MMLEKLNLPIAKVLGLHLTIFCGDFQWTENPRDGLIIYEGHLATNWNALMTAVAKIPNASFFRDENHWSCWQDMLFDTPLEITTHKVLRCKHHREDFTIGNSESEALALARCIREVQQ